MIQNIENRRKFLKTATLGSVASIGMTTAAFALENLDLKTENSLNGWLSVVGMVSGSAYKPLQTIVVKSTVRGKFIIRDGKSLVYSQSDKEVDSFSFQIGGSLGYQSVTLVDKAGKTLDATAFLVDCKTEIKDKAGVYNELMQMLYWTLVGEWGENSIYRYKGDFYSVFVSWIRDHTHTLKAMKYFSPKVKDGFDIFAVSQRADGMVWDNIYKRDPERGWWDDVLAKGDFIKIFEDDPNYEFKRQPVEADVEYLFVECLYFSWKACGDNAWMAKGLGNAIKALKYSMMDRYRWSEKYKLIKRGFTIDTWDFVHDYDHTQTGYGAGQCIDADTNEFGIMFGDNNGFIAACKYLAEMLEVASRKSEADDWRKIGNDMQIRLDKTAWNGEFYTHYVPENEGFWLKRDIGKTDPAKQVSLSNAYALNRGITHAQAIKIINTYQRIRNEMPKGSVGEWYAIYPPFEHGFGKDNALWEYMNGGVITIVAGELAHAAFEHGYESYGVDILKRISEIGKKHNNYLHCTYKGAKTEPPKANFTTISLKNIANADFNGKGAVGVPGFSGEGEENDLSNIPIGKQSFVDIPFEVIDPAANGRKACLIVSTAKNYVTKASLSVGKKATAIYFLCGRSNEALVATATLMYDDGTQHIEFLNDAKVGHWWYPVSSDQWKVAFGVKNKKSSRVGLGVYGLENPNPDKLIVSIGLEIMKVNAAKLYIAGITLSDQKPYFDAGDVSFGIPDRWGSAAVVYGLVEGLAGVKDSGVAFDKVLFAPRWQAANETEAAVTIKYEASGGYFSYTYKMESSVLQIQFTGSGTNVTGEILLPTGKVPKSITLNQNPMLFKIKKVEGSSYLAFTSDVVGVSNLKVNF